MQATTYRLYCLSLCMQWLNISEIKGVILGVTKSTLVLLCTLFTGNSHDYRGKDFSSIGLNTGFLQGSSGKQNVQILIMNQRVEKEDTIVYFQAFKKVLLPALD